MPQDAGCVLVSLPCLAPFVVQHSFNGLQLPASYLLSALDAVLSSCKQQYNLQPDSSPAAAAQQLLPVQGISCSVDLQLVAVAVEQHPLGGVWGRVGLVQRVSNVLHAAAVLQAEQQGSCYRWGIFLQVCIHTLVWKCFFQSMRNGAAHVLRGSCCCL
jgi:hypothetical protein